MHQAARPAETVAFELPALFAPIREELAQVEAILHRELHSSFPQVDEVVRHGCGLGGKRLRPALLLLSAKAAGSVRHDHLVLSAVVEMIHTATLIHDDVLDEATLRRHRPTVNARWNNQTSVLLGDFLFTHAFYLASTLDSTFACQTIGRATNVVCEGELRQIATQDDFDLGEAEYLSIIEAKTAELCACCCRLGAHYAGASADVEESLAAFGRDLGIAFQIVDDLLDLEGQEVTVGKSLGTDLRQRKLTLPLIHLLAEADTVARSALIETLAVSQEQDGFLEQLEKSGALAYARHQASQFAERARAALTDLPPSTALDVLGQLPQFVIERQR